MLFPCLKRNDKALSKADYVESELFLYLKRFFPWLCISKLYGMIPTREFLWQMRLLQKWIASIRILCIINWTIPFRYEPFHLSKYDCFYKRVLIPMMLPVQIAPRGKGENYKKGFKFRKKFKFRQQVDWVSSCWGENFAENCVSRQLSRVDYDKLEKGNPIMI